MMQSCYALPTLRGATVWRLFLYHQNLSLLGCLTCVDVLFANCNADVRCSFEGWPSRQSIDR